MPPLRIADTHRHKERGNVLFMILIAIILIGALSAAIMSGSQPENAAISNETLSIRASEVQRYASEMERGVMFILNNGVSESDIRFAHPDANSDYGDLSADTDKTDQLFHRDGGGVTFREPPDDINDGSAWEFYGGTHMPGVGSNKAELIAVLPNVTDEFCDKINTLNNQSSAPTDTGASAASGSDPGSCLNIGSLGRFDDAQQFYDTVNTVDETTFAQDTAGTAARTALEACVTCALDSENHYYHVLLAR